MIDSSASERVPGVPIALHLSPTPTHRVLVYRTAKQRGEPDDGTLAD
jgi:hypothetical protein